MITLDISLSLSSKTSVSPRQSSGAFYKLNCPFGQEMINIITINWA